MVILDVCQNFVVKDKVSNVLRLAHTSVHDFLREKVELSDSHTLTAEICLALLCSTDQESEPDESPKARTRSFYNYSAKHWANHTRLSGNDSDASLMELQKDFLRPPLAYTDCLQKCSS